LLIAERGNLLAPVGQLKQIALESYDRSPDEGVSLVLAGD
jgi:hypothetical protein